MHLLDTFITSPLFILTAIILFILPIKVSIATDEEVAVHDPMEQDTDALFTYRHMSFSICLISMFILCCFCVLVNFVVHHKINKISRSAEIAKVVY